MVAQNGCDTLWIEEKVENWQSGEDCYQYATKAKSATLMDPQQPVDGGWSEWTPFGECNTDVAKLGSIVRTSTRTCDNPVPAFGGEDCVGESSQTETCPSKKCATLFSAYPSWKNGDKSVEAGEYDISDLSKFGGENWMNTISYVVVEPKCTFDGFSRKDFDSSLGRWSGQLDAVNSHEMDPEYENDKMKSFKCSCDENQTCKSKYTYGSAPVPGCLAPECDIVD